MIAGHHNKLSSVYSEIIRNKSSSLTEFSQPSDSLEQLVMGSFKTIQVHIVTVLFGGLRLASNIHEVEICLDKYLWKTLYFSVI